MWKKILLFSCCLLTLSLLSAQKQKEYNLAFDNNNIHFKTFGKKGLPILIINGGPGMHSEGFIPLAQTLAAQHQTIVYDQRGTGRSTMKEVNAETITLDKMLADIEAIREHLGHKDWVVFGHSFGGMLASYYAAKHPDRVKGLILSSSGGVDMELFSNLNIQGRLSPSNRDSLAYWQNQIAQGDTSHHARYQRGKYLAPAYLYDTSHVPVIAERLTQGNWTINGLVFQDMNKMGFDCKAELETFPRPCLILQGAEDIIDPDISYKAAEILPKAEMHLIGKCGHYGWLEQPETYFLTIDLYLEQLN